MARRIELPPRTSSEDDDDEHTLRSLMQIAEYCASAHHPDEARLILTYVWATGERTECDELLSRMRRESTTRPVVLQSLGMRAYVRLGLALVENLGGTTPNIWTLVVYGRQYSRNAMLGWVRVGLREADDEGNWAWTWAWVTGGVAFVVAVDFVMRRVRS